MIASTRYWPPDRSCWPTTLAPTSFLPTCTSSPATRHRDDRYRGHSSPLPQGIQNLIAMIDPSSFDQLKEMKTERYKVYSGNITIFWHSKSIILENKEQLITFMECYKDKHGVDSTFSRHREWPGILMCFVFRQS